MWCWKRRSISKPWRTSSARSDRGSSQRERSDTSKKRNSMIEEFEMIEHSEDQARRAAKRVGLRARKSRWRANSIDNLGEFQIIDPMRNWIVAGERFNFTADDVIEFCRDYENRI